MSDFVIRHGFESDHSPPMFVSTDDAEYTDFVARAQRFADYESAALNVINENETVYELDEETGEIEIATDPNKGKT